MVDIIVGFVSSLVLGFVGGAATVAGAMLQSPLWGAAPDTLVPCALAVFAAGAATATVSKSNSNKSNNKYNTKHYPPAPNFFAWCSALLATLPVLQLLLAIFFTDDAPPSLTVRIASLAPTLVSLGAATSCSFLHGKAFMSPLFESLTNSPGIFAVLSFFVATTFASTLLQNPLVTPPELLGILAFVSLIAARTYSDVNRVIFTTAVLTAAILTLIPQFSRFRVAGPTLSNQSILEKVYSSTGYISVVEDPNIHGGIRVLRCDHSIIGGIFLAENYHGDSVYSSFYNLAFVTGFQRSTFSSKQNYKVLNVGLGIGIAAKTLLSSHSNSHIDVVDLDPEVLRFAVKHFSFPNVSSQTTFHAADGRKFLEDADDNVYDYVLHDVFTNGGVANNLVSFEALSHIRRVLVDDGVLALNFVGTVKSLSTLSLIRTLKTVFPHVSCYPEDSGKLDDPKAFYNMVFFAAKNPLIFDVRQIPDPFSSRNRLKKTTSNGESLGHVRAHALEKFPSLRRDALVDAVVIFKTSNSYENTDIGGGGVLLHDDLVNISSEMVTILKSDQEDIRKGHYKLMINQFGHEFWLMF
ncbi:hypothetical protein HK100_006806 [Physocladia obscura]|uniref:PABS domain-containing protein n=1 Tax=Physocladia obscura TaxID=109957 RepID=A0AAD5T515_9FUNG|nr:hypothetical protein HK100_006806 [Physocladia obscura]